MLSTLLILDSTRGIDSTGIAHIGRGGDVSLAKAIGNPFELLGSRQFNKVTTPNARAIIGHNRFATQGKISKMNAHPFEFENIVGVHNGTLTNKWELLDNKEFDVDSENLYHHMNQKGLYDLLGVMCGAWSLVWWDKKEEELCFLRNKERPMWMTWSKDFKSLYWASEAWMLEVALNKSGVPYHEIAETEVDQLYTFPIDKAGIVYKPSMLARPSRSVFFVGSPVLNNGGRNQGKVVNIAKQTLPSNLAADQRKGMVMELLTESVDNFGAQYFVVFYPVKPEWNIRLYVNKHQNDNVFKMGMDIVCDLSDTSYLEYPKGQAGEPVIYYKVVASTAVPILLTEPDEETEELINDSNGKPLTRTEWMAKHGTCDYCTGFVNPDSEYRFTHEGEVLCHECAGDKRITEFCFRLHK